MRSTLVMTSMPLHWVKPTAAAGDCSTSEGSDLLELKQSLGTTVKRTRTASSEMDMNDRSDSQSSDDPTETESTNPEQQDQPPAHASVFSLARAGLSSSSKKLFGLSAGKQMESDTAPFTPDTIVSTKFGLGTVLEVREGDGITAVQLQSRPPMMLYTTGNGDDCYAVPALVGDWVHTPAGEGCVLGYDSYDQMYAVRIGGEVEYECRIRQGDVQRYVRPPRRTTSSSAPSAALQKGISTALKTIVSTSSGISASTYQFVSNKLSWNAQQQQHMEKPLETVL